MHYLPTYSCYAVSFQPIPVMHHLPTNSCYALSFQPIPVIHYLSNLFLLCIIFQIYSCYALSFQLIPVMHYLPTYTCYALSFQPNRVMHYLSNLFLLCIIFPTYSCYAYLSHFVRNYRLIQWLQNLAKKLVKTKISQIINILIFNFWMEVSKYCSKHCKVC